MVQCPKCSSEEVGITLTRKLHYKIESVNDDGELNLGALIESEDIAEFDDFFCITCDHSWARE